MPLEQYQFIKLPDTGRPEPISNYYSPVFHKLSFSYHKEGKQWPQETFETFFQEGLLQAYVAQYHSYDFNYQYNDPTKQVPLYAIYSHFGVTFSARKNSEHRWYRSVFEPLFAKLKTIPLLSQLGAHFQRLKLENESLEKKLTEPQKEIYLQEMYTNDRKLHEIETVVFNWVLYFGDEIKEFFKQHGYKLDKIESEINTFIPCDSPSFVSQKNLPLTYTEINKENLDKGPDDQKEKTIHQELVTNNNNELTPTWDKKDCATGYQELRSNAQEKQEQQSSQPLEQQQNYNASFSPFLTHTIS